VFRRPTLKIPVAMKTGRLDVTASRYQEATEVTPEWIRCQSISAPRPGPMPSSVSMRSTPSGTGRAGPKLAEPAGRRS
jgi:hypothetical protein